MSGPWASSPLLLEKKDAGETQVGLARLGHFRMSKSATADFDPAVPSYASITILGAALPAPAAI